MKTVEAGTVSRPGYSTGFETLEAEVDIDSLAIEGSIPEWLSGTLLRNGPAKFEAGEQPLRHWFDGLAMLHRFSFAGGRVSYANRFLRSEAYRAAQDGRISYSEFATDPCRSIFKRAATMFRPRLTDNCNVNLTRLGDEYIAMTETPLPVSFDPETLETLGVSFRSPGIHATAHPHHDPERGELVAYVTHFGPRSEYRVFAQRDRATQRRIASMRVAEPSYMHSFALTERYAILVAFPLVVNPLSLALSGRPFIENYRWKPEQGTRVLVFDREDGELRGEHMAEPRFSFHHVNAFERDGELVLDMVAYDDATIVDSLYIDRLRAASPPETSLAKLLRYRVGLDSGGVREEELSDELLELPRIDYRERNGRPYRHVYAAGTRTDGEFPDFIDQLVKVDVEAGEVKRWSEPGSYPGEPVFVPAPRPDRAEDDGVLLSVVLDGRSGSSYLLVLDAAGLEELGRARVPHHIPFGFHGQYFS
ncbi:MAG TPA: carotenoid oxygenase family protein [Solirubrobacterales bacterium]|jgi:carotenoid cleavage dioxygenase-like enzyme|nr:carotenoid oxygenase family protein [Solirubrobacterales bacterium]